MIYVSVHDVHIMFDILDGLLMSMMLYDVFLHMKMFSILNMSYDDDFHTASCHWINLGYNLKSM